VSELLEEIIRVVVLSLWRSAPGLPGGFLWEGVSGWRSSEGSLDKLGMTGGRGRDRLSVSTGSGFG
jgi:hypothetical protein